MTVCSSNCPTSLTQELAIICSFVCSCNITPIESKQGSALKQLCVDIGLSWLHGSGQGLNILPEVGYVMTKPPTPVLKETMAGIPEPIRNHWHRFNKAKAILKETGVEEYTKGMLRVPDITITRQAGQPPYPANIKHIVEIKFPGDKWGEGQRKAYEKIADNEDNVTELTPARCGCRIAAGVG